ncbi:MAG TPA: radical SAM protein, partial [Longimicrobiaceae bacterium]|nr:radical SAM protein [Longimicrobiaceae bacterium]
MLTRPLEIARRRLTLLTDRIHTLPVLVLMPHSRCNCRCVMCDIWKANGSPREISAGDLSAHLEALRRLRVQWVVLSGGEALMHGDVDALCSLLRQIPARITLLSTGLLLAPRAARVVECCDEVIVSLDGSRGVHDGIRRVPRAFDRLAEGVAALRAVAPGYRVTGRCVLQRRNWFDLPNIIRAAHEIGLDGISFLAADVSSTAFNRPEGWKPDRVADIALDGAEARAFAQVVEQVVREFEPDFASGYIAETPAKLRRIPAYYGALAGAGELPEVTCNAPWVSAVVEPDGAVRPCFFHPPIGHLDDGPLDEVVNSAAARGF